MDKLFVLEIPDDLSSFLVNYKTLEKINKLYVSDYLTEAYKLGYRILYDTELDLNKDTKWLNKVYKVSVSFINHLNTSDQSFYPEFIKVTLSLARFFSDFIAKNDLNINYRCEMFSPGLFKILRKE